MWKETYGDPHHTWKEVWGDSHRMWKGAKGDSHSGYASPGPRRIRRAASPRHLACASERAPSRSSKLPDPLARAFSSPPIAPKKTIGFEGFGALWCHCSAILLARDDAPHRSECAREYADGYASASDQRRSDAGTDRAGTLTHKACRSNEGVRKDVRACIRLMRETSTAVKSRSWSDIRSPGSGRLPPGTGAPTIRTAVASPPHGIVSLPRNPR